LGLALENFLLKSQIFQFYAPHLKKISLGLVKKYQGQSWDGLLFTAGKKFAWVGSDQGPSLLPARPNPEELILLPT